MNGILFSTQPLLIPLYTKTNTRFKRYNFEFLRRYCAGMEVLAREPLSGAKKEFRIGDYLDYMDKKSDSGLFYISDWQYWRHDVFSEINPLSVTENWLDLLPANFIPKLAWMFVGKAGTHSSLHIDLLNTSAWNVLFEGEKRWYFFPPNFKFLSDDLDTVDVTDEYYRTHPDVVEFHQQKGDLIYTPSGWYHQVFNESHSFAITENFLDATNYNAVYDYFALRNEEYWLKLLTELKGLINKKTSS